MTAATDTFVWWEHLVPYCPAMGPYLGNDSVSEIEVNPGGQVFPQRRRRSAA